MFGISNRNNDYSQILMVPIGKIKPNSGQPRRYFDHEALLSLAESIKQNGILQPLSVRKRTNGDYELVAGERRLRASLIAGLTHVPCIEVQLSDTQSTVMALIENLQREDLNFFEEADGIARLIESCGMTQEEIAQKLGKNQSTIANKLRLLRISPNERKTILEGKLTERHARALLRVDDIQKKELLEKIIEKQLNVNETERLVESMIYPKKEPVKQKKFPIIKDIRLFINTVNNAVNVMKNAGIQAVAIQEDHEDYMEYIVKIPKCGTKKAG